MRDEIVVSRVLDFVIAVMLVLVFFLLFFSISPQPSYENKLSLSCHENNTIQADKPELKPCYKKENRHNMPLRETRIRKQTKLHDLLLCIRILMRSSQQGIVASFQKNSLHYPENIPYHLPFSQSPSEQY